MRAPSVNYIFLFDKAFLIHTTGVSGQRFQIVVPACQKTNISAPAINWVDSKADIRIKKIGNDRILY